MSELPPEVLEVIRAWAEEAVREAFRPYFEELAFLKESLRVRGLREA